MLTQKCKTLLLKPKGSIWANEVQSRYATYKASSSLIMRLLIRDGQNTEQPSSIDPSVNEEIPERLHCFDLDDLPTVNEVGKAIKEMQCAKPIVEAACRPPTPWTKKYLPEWQRQVSRVVDCRSEIVVRGD
jgi:hypothetical protein